MRTFYDYRGTDWSNPKKYPLQGRVIFKYKHRWLLWIWDSPGSGYLDKNPLNALRGFIICPKTIYLYDVYHATGIWDGIKNLFFKPKPVKVKHTHNILHILRKA